MFGFNNWRKYYNIFKNTTDAGYKLSTSLKWNVKWLGELVHNSGRVGQSTK